MNTSSAILSEATNASVWMKQDLNAGRPDPHQYEYLVKNWADETDADVDPGSAYDDLTADDQAKFASWLEQNYDSVVPSYDAEPWRYFDEAELVLPNTWLVHFSNDAEDIAMVGFQYGADAENLHLSRLNRGPKLGPWVFAFVSDSADASHAAADGKYGKKAVMFKSSSALKAWHNGDEENQVMVDRDSVPVRNLVYLSRGDDDEWRVGPEDHPLITGTFDRVELWVRKNYDQYRARLSPG